MGVFNPGGDFFPLAPPPLGVGAGWYPRGIARRSGRQVALCVSVDLSALAEATLRSMSSGSTHRLLGIGSLAWAALDGCSSTIGAREESSVTPLLES